MISQSVLFDAKAFLCWEKFPNLSIKLIPIEAAIAFFYPPTKDISSIKLFYQKNTKDFSQALCLLFHEAGHFKQWQNLSDQGNEEEFWERMNLDKSERKVDFERDAWRIGQELLSEFLAKIDVDKNILINVYKLYAAQSLTTYK